MVRERSCILLNFLLELIDTCMPVVSTDLYYISTRYCTAYSNHIFIM